MIILYIMNYYNWNCHNSDNDSVSSDDTDYLINTPCNVDVSDFETEVMSSSNVINKTLNNVVSSYFLDKKPTMSSVKPLQRPRNIANGHLRSKSFEEKTPRSRSGDVYYVNDSVILSVSFVDKMDEKVKEGQEILKRLLAGSNALQKDKSNLGSANKRTEKFLSPTSREIIDRYSLKLHNNFSATADATKLNDLYENRILPSRPLSYDSICGLGSPINRTGSANAWNSRPYSSLSNHNNKENDFQFKRNCSQEEVQIKDIEKSQTVIPHSTFHFKQQSPVTFKKLPEFEEIPNKSSCASNTVNTENISEETKNLFESSNQNSDDDSDQVPKIYLQSSFTSGEVSLEEENVSNKKTQEESDVLFSSFISNSSKENIEEHSKHITNELCFLQEVHQKETDSLLTTVELLRQQKNTLLDHVHQLKDALSNKNQAFSDLQDRMNIKTKQYLTDELERQNLKDEVSILTNTKAWLGNHIAELEKALNDQCNQLKELEKLFNKEREAEKLISMKKDEEIARLHESLQEFHNRSLQLNEEICIHSLKQEEVITEQKIYQLKLEEEIEAERKLCQQKVDDAIAGERKANQNFYEEELKKQHQGFEIKLNNIIAENHAKYKNELDIILEENRKLKQQVETIQFDLLSEQNRKLTQQYRYEDQINELQTKVDTKQNLLINLESELHQVKEQFKKDYQQMELRCNELLLTINQKNEEIRHLNEVVLIEKSELAQANEEKINLKNDFYETMKQKNENIQHLNEIILIDKSELSKTIEERTALKNKLYEYEKQMKSAAIELLEECSKMRIIAGSPPSTKQKNFEYSKDQSSLSEAMATLSSQLKYFCGFVQSLQQENESLMQNNDELAVCGTLPSSAKLLRHFQLRLKMMRKENEALRERHIDTMNQEHFSNADVVLQNKVQELQHCLQEKEKDINQKTVDLMNMQVAISRLAKEKTKLEKAHAKLLADWDQKGHIKEVQFAPPLPSTHVVALGPTYPGTTITKTIVPSDCISWHRPFPNYNPVMYTAEIVLKNPEWADKEIGGGQSPKMLFNSMDGKVNRKSHMGHYAVVDGYPRNPVGRTGMIGRGLLGRWGPNHAADPILTRWGRSSNGSIVKHCGRPVLEFVAIQRKDSGQWAIPGGMVDPGEKISATLRREFSEEALGSLDMTVEAQALLRDKIKELFKHGTLVYKGYVDDIRNTDNAWMETVAVNFHDDDGNSISHLPLKAGDDAKNVQWMKIDKKLELYANHADFIRQTCEMRGAYFFIE
ncbi:TATA element modulatory factor isoform X1 [Hydra vulgaris]|nr:TATA element modulatory factor isoform X1 [Hydra vulgaris]